MNSSDNPGFITRLMNWASMPITQPMDMLAVVLTTILIVTVATVWYGVLEHVTEA
jgi:hypothetical protein